MTDRTMFEDALLGLLHEGPRHGYDLASHFAEGGDLAAVGRLGKSQLYALLKALEEHGLARATLREGDGGPARRVFQVTEPGRKRFAEWVHRPVDSVRGLRVEFLLKLYFLARLGLPGQAVLMGAQAEVLRRRRDRLGAVDEGEPGIGPWVRSLQEDLLEACLRWLSEWGRKAPEQAPAPRRPARRRALEVNRLRARVSRTEAHGGVVRADLELEAGGLAVLLPRETATGLGLAAGAAVTVVVPPGGVVLEPYAPAEPQESESTSV